MIIIYYKRGDFLSTGIIVLFIVGVLILIGVAQNALDHLYLTDNWALFIVVLIIAGSYFDIPLSQQPPVSANVGGVIIPVLLSLYVWSRADSGVEKFRTFIAIIFTTVVIYFVSFYFRNYGEGRDIIDPFIMFITAGGITAYIIGKTRRGAFVAGILGYFGYEMINLLQLTRGEYLTEVRIGRGGALDTIILSGIVAILLAEIIGEGREAIFHRNKRE